MSMSSSSAAERRRRGPVAYPSAQSFAVVSERAQRELAHARKGRGGSPRNAKTAATASAGGKREGRRSEPVAPGRESSFSASFRSGAAAGEEKESRGSSRGESDQREAALSPRSARVERIRRYQRREWSWEERPAYERRLADAMEDTKSLEGRVSEDIRGVRDLEAAALLFDQMAAEDTSSTPLAGKLAQDVNDDMLILPRPSAPPSLLAPLASQQLSVLESGTVEKSSSLCSLDAGSSVLMESENPLKEVRALRPPYREWEKRKPAVGSMNTIRKAPPLPWEDEEEEDDEVNANRRSCSREESADDATALTERCLDLKRSLREKLAQYDERRGFGKQFPSRALDEECKETLGGISVEACEGENPSDGERVSSLARRGRRSSEKGGPGPMQVDGEGMSAGVGRLRKSTSREVAAAPAADGVGFLEDRGAAAEVSAVPLGKKKLPAPLPRVATLPTNASKPQSPREEKHVASSATFNPDRLQSVQRHAEFLVKQEALKKERDLREAQQRGFKARPVPRCVTGPPIMPQDDKKNKLLRRLAARGVKTGSPEAKLVEVMLLDRESAELVEKLLDDPLVDVLSALSSLAAGDSSDSDESTESDGSGGGGVLGDVGDNEKNPMRAMLARQKTWEISKERRRSELAMKLEAEAEAELKAQDGLHSRPNDGRERWEKVKAQHRLSYLREQEATLERDRLKRAASERRESQVKKQLQAAVSSLQHSRRRKKRGAGGENETAKPPAQRHDAASSSDAERVSQMRLPDESKADNEMAGDGNGGGENDDDSYVKALSRVLGRQERTSAEPLPPSRIIFLGSESESAGGKEQDDDEEESVGAWNLHPSRSSSDFADDFDATQAGPCPEAVQYLSHVGKDGHLDSSLEDSVLYGSWEGGDDDVAHTGGGGEKKDIYLLEPHERWGLLGGSAAQFFDPITSTPDKGRFRVADARRFLPDSLRREKDGDTGVTLLLGRCADRGEEERLITVMFDRGLFNEVEAAAWWKRNVDRFKASNYLVR